MSEDKEEINWSKAKISRKPCPICGVDILEYNAVKKIVKEMEQKLRELDVENAFISFDEALEDFNNKGK
jgi:transcription initiation factor IIE alpha subunit